MQDHRYILEPYKGMNTRHRCPGCDKNKTFALYIDAETNEPLSSHAGRCNRESECGYHYTPKQYFNDNGIVPEQSAFIHKPKAEPLPTSYIDKDVFAKSLTRYEDNNFIKFLQTLFDSQTVAAAIDQYQIGTSKHWPGATIFWQMDLNSNTRTGKIMLYNDATGKRVKEPINYITWAHTALKVEAFNLKQCLFGLPLINNTNKPIAIVESEKTAIIASMYLPQLIWLACGGIGNLNKDVCTPLKGRKVILYPDLNAFAKWSVKAKELGFNISDLLERKATEEEKRKGLDIADYLTSMKPFNMRKSTLPSQVVELQQYYSELEVNGLIPDQHRSYIGSLWQGIEITIQPKHFSLSLYIEALQLLKMEIEQLRMTA
jgi:hypothetical protein